VLISTDSRSEKHPNVLTVGDGEIYSASKQRWTVAGLARAVGYGTAVLCSPYLSHRDRYMAPRF